MGAIEPRTVQLKDGRRVLLRTLTEEDAAALIDFLVRVPGTSDYTVTRSDEVERDLEAQKRRCRERVEKPGHLHVAAEHEGSLVGALDFTNGHRRRTAHRGEFGVAIDEAWRGVGLGRALITALLDWAAANPLIEKVNLGVFPQNTRARGLYESLGFVQEARRPREIKLGPGRYADDIFMRLYVKPGVAPQGFNTYAPGDRP